MTADYFNAFGCVPWLREYPPWLYQISTLLCPSDGRARVKRAIMSSAEQITCFSRGDTILDNQGPVSAEACSVPSQSVNFAAIRDGSSNTLAISERVVCSSDSIALKDPRRCDWKRIRDESEPYSFVWQCAEHGRYAGGRAKTRLYRNALVRRTPAGERLHHRLTSQLAILPGRKPRLGMGDLDALQQTHEWS